MSSVPEIENVKSRNFHAGIDGVNTFVSDDHMLWRKILLNAAWRAGFGHLFGIRNAKRSLAKTPWLWATIFGNTRGRRIGSGRLPELRRFWICCEARGLEREVRWRRVYPDEMSRLRGHRPEAPYLTYDRRLTARPAVLAKRTEPDRHTSRPTDDGPARTSLSSCWEFPYAIPAALVRRRGEDVAVSTRFLPLPFAR
jgi:hypothetical protein